jgi:hypothetical protein
MQTKHIYTGIVVNLNIDTITLPNGLTVDLEVVRHPGAAAVVPLTQQEDSSMKSPQGNFILVKIPRSARPVSLKKKSDIGLASWSSSPASSPRQASPTK